MSYIINGKTLPPVAIGTWGWGSGANGSGIIFGAKADPEKLKESFETAMKSGFNLFDTAAVYGMGNAEKLLAEFSKGREIIFSDKYTPIKKYTAARVDDMYSGSVDVFSGRKPDIYWLHQPKDIEQTIEYLCQMKKDGKIGSIGDSNFNLEQVKVADKIARENGCTITGVQNHFSLLYRESEENGVLEWCKESGAIFFSYMVLEQGALTGKFTSKKPMPMLSRRGIAFNKSRLKKIEPLIAEMEKIGGNYGLTVSQTATAYAITKGTLPIIGVRKPYQAEELAKTASVVFTSKEIESLEKAAHDTGIKVKASWE